MELGRGHGAGGVAVAGVAEDVGVVVGWGRGHGRGYQVRGPGNVILVTWKQVSSPPFGPAALGMLQECVWLHRECLRRGSPPLKLRTWGCGVPAARPALPLRLASPFPFQLEAEALGPRQPWDSHAEHVPLGLQTT